MPHDSRSCLGQNICYTYAVPLLKLTKLAKRVLKAASHVVVPRPDSDCLAGPTPTSQHGCPVHESVGPTACLPVLVSLSLFSPLTDTRVKHLTEMADPSRAMLAQIQAVEMAAATCEAREAEEDKLTNLGVPLSTRRPGKRRRGRRRNRRRKTRGRPAASSSSSSSSAPSSRVATRLPKFKAKHQNQRQEANARLAHPCPPNRQTAVNSYG